MDSASGKPKRGRGRPAKEQKMTEYRITLYLPSEEALEAVKEAAQKEGLGVSAWVRSLVYKEARAVLGRDIG